MRVTKTLLSHWNVSESEVLKAARQNTESLCPGKIMNMLGVISGMLEPSEKELFPDTEKIPHDMYVLTNINQVNGATVMMYDSFLKRLHQKMGTFVLLPSSIHEVIVYPFDKNSMSFYEYQQMVMEINQTCVLEEEVLADSVYLYDGNQIQCHHYMAVTGAKAWYIAVVILGREFLWQRIERKIKVFMQDAEVAENDHYRISWKNSTSNRIDTTRLKAEIPDVYTHFCKPTQSRRFLVKAVS